MKRTVKLISAICAIVMLLGLLPVMSVSAADATLVVTPSKDEVKAGREFTVTVSLENNPGLFGLSFILTYDENAFEYIKPDENDENAILFEQPKDVLDNVCVLDEKEGGEIFYIRGSTNILSNTTKNGKLAVITFKAKENAALTNYTFSVEIDPLRTEDIDGKQVAIAGASAKVKVVENIAVSTIDSAMVQLGEDIAVNYFVTLDEDHAGAQMRFTFGEDVTVVDGVATEVENEYVYTFKGIAPQAMGDNLKAELIFGGNVVASKDEYSILANCQNLLTKSAAELELNAEQYAAMKTLIADLLVYGAKAQAYRYYKTDALVDAGVTGATALGVIGDENTIKTIAPSTNANIKFTAGGVFFDYTNSIYFKFVAPGVTASNLKVVITKYDSDLNPIETNTYTINDCILIDEATSEYKILIDDISVLDYGTAYSADLQMKSGFQYSSVQFFAYSVNSYAHAMQNNSNTKMADLAKALYNYGVSAVAFQNSFNG